MKILSQTPCNGKEASFISPSVYCLLYSIISLYKCLITLAGLPPTTVLSSASFVTTAPAVTITFSLTVTLRRMGHPSPDPAVPFQTDRFVSENLMVVQVMVVGYALGIGGDKHIFFDRNPSCRHEKRAVYYHYVLSILTLLPRTTVIGSITRLFSPILPTNSSFISLSYYPEGRRE